MSSPGSGPHLAEEVFDHQVEEVGLARLEDEGTVAVDAAVLLEPPFEPRAVTVVSTRHVVPLLDLLRRPAAHRQ